MDKLDTVYRLVKQKYNINKEDVVGCYLFGSRVYGTNDYNSDYDYILITNKNVNNQEIKHKIVNIHIYTVEHFQNLLDEHKIKQLEVFFKNKEELTNKGFKFSLDLIKLREEISSVSNNSWVKCKKKLTVEEDEYFIGVKSLFHSLRILDFGSQIAEYGEITNYSYSNDIWDNIKDKKWDKEQYNWEYFNTFYKKIYNSKKSYFKKLAPKV